MDDKNLRLEEALRKIEKSYGKGTIVELGSKKIIQLDVVSTGSYLLDRTLGIGGYPRGRIVEIYGPESSGKTTLALIAISEVQKLDGIAAYIDIEHAIDPLYAKQLGVNLNRLLLSQPDSGEDALDVAETLLNSKAIDILIIDSVAALVPKVELEGEMSDLTIGAQARLMSKALRKIISAISHSNCIVIFINQLREKVGTYFGNPEVTPGGRALKFYSSIRIDVRQKERIVENNQIIGQQMKLKIVKNKLYTPYKQVLINLYYGKGINKNEELFELGLEMNLITKSGSWYSYQNQQLGQGKINALNELLKNEEIFKILKDDIDKNIKAYFETSDNS